MPTLNVMAAWFAMLAGVVSGAVVGLFFHRDDWMGGYGSYRRRLTRLGHISFFGLGFLNLMFAVTAGPLGLHGFCLRYAAGALIVGAVSMPVCCFLSAWRKPMRHLFPIPVVAVMTGILAILAGRWMQ